MGIFIGAWVVVTPTDCEIGIQKVEIKLRIFFLCEGYNSEKIIHRAYHIKYMIQTLRSFPRDL